MRRAAKYISVHGMMAQSLEENSKKLLEDIPNKIQNKLGIVADVNLLTKDGLDYIEIVVSPWSFPVNYDGEYHYRSGSTKHLLRGNALINFLMTKTGLKWMPPRFQILGLMIWIFQMQNCWRNWTWWQTANLNVPELYAFNGSRRRSSVAAM